MRRALPLLLLPLVCVRCACPPEEVTDAGSHIGDLAPKDAGEIVRPDSGVDPHLLPCQEDVLEDNDTSGAATPVATSQDIQAVLCEGDADWFVAPAGDGCSIDARIAFDPGYGDLDLHLFAPDGALLDAATSAGDSESVQATVGAAGGYLVRVTGPTTAKTAYTLRVEVVCPELLACPADDPYEENDDGLSAHVIGDAEEAAGIICAQDPDYYVLPSQAGCVLDATLSFVDDDGDLDLEMLVGERVLASSRGTGDTEHVIKAAPDGVVPVLRVFGFQDAENTYRLLVDQVCPSEMSCPADDPFEPNDDAVSSVALSPPDGAAGMVCGTDEDWFDFFAATGCVLSVDLDFANADGDLDLKLLRGDGTQVGSSTSTDDDEHIDFTVDTGGTFRVRVYGYAGAENRYRLLVDAACP